MKTKARESNRIHLWAELTDVAERLDALGRRAVEVGDHRTARQIGLARRLCDAGRDAVGLGGEATNV